jgi:hypothetical protein
VNNQAQLTRAQRASDTVTEFCGSWSFIIAFSGITLGWMAFNTFKIFTVFDPYPYILLNLFLTVVSTFQSPLIMMSQNRQIERDREAITGLHRKLDALLALKLNRDPKVGPDIRLRLLCVRCGLPDGQHEGWCGPILAAADSTSTADAVRPQKSEGGE